MRNVYLSPRGIFKHSLIQRQWNVFIMAKKGSGRPRNKAGQELKVNTKIVDPTIEKLVQDALKAFDKYDDVWDANRGEFVVGLETWGDESRGIHLMPHVYGILQDFVDGMPEIPNKDEDPEAYAEWEDWAYEDVDDAAGVLSDYINQQPAVEKAKISFTIDTFESGDYGIDAAMEKKDYEARYGKTVEGQKPAKKKSTSKNKTPLKLGTAAERLNKDIKENDSYIRNMEFLLSKSSQGSDLYNHYKGLLFDANKKQKKLLIKKSKIEKTTSKNKTPAKKKSKTAIKPKTFRIVQTYDIVTEESAAEGEFAESGWEDEEGREYPNTAQGIADAAKYLESQGVIMFDSWFSTEEEQDYKTGESRTDNFHVHVGKHEPAGDSEQERIIAEKIAAKLKMLNPGIHINLAKKSGKKDLSGQVNEPMIHDVQKMALEECKEKITHEQAFYIARSILRKAEERDDLYRVPTARLCKLVEASKKIKNRGKKSHGNKAVVFGAEINPMKRWIVAEIDTKAGTKKQLAGTFTNEKKALEALDRTFKDNTKAKTIQWAEFKRLKLQETRLEAKKSKGKGKSTNVVIAKSMGFTIVMSSAWKSLPADEKRKIFHDLQTAYVNPGDYGDNFIVGIIDADSPEPESKFIAKVRSAINKLPEKYQDLVEDIITDENESKKSKGKGSKQPAGKKKSTRTGQIPQVVINALGYHVDRFNRDITTGELKDDLKDLGYKDVSNMISMLKNAGYISPVKDMMGLGPGYAIKDISTPETKMSELMIGIESMLEETGSESSVLDDQIEISQEVLDRAFQSTTMKQDEVTKQKMLAKLLNYPKLFKKTKKGYEMDKELYHVLKWNLPVEKYLNQTKKTSKSKVVKTIVIVKPSIPGIKDPIMYDVLYPVTNQTGHLNISNEKFSKKNMERVSKDEFLKLLREDLTPISMYYNPTSGLIFYGSFPKPLIYKATTIKDLIVRGYA